MAETLKQKVARGVAKLAGWRVIPRDTIPDRCVVIGFPHTTNWDFVLLLLGSAVYGKKLHWLGKAELFKYGAGPIMRYLGGIAVRRDAPHGLVREIADAFARTDVMRLVIPPEGTRKKTDYWKSGFYRIAFMANVPLHLGIVDYIARTIDFGDPMPLSGNVRADMDQIRAWYAGANGLHPELMGEIRLKDEDKAAADV